MTDKDKLKALLDEWEVPYDESDGDIVITERRDSSKITGYTGFYTAFDFDSDGGFERVGAWE